MKERNEFRETQKEFKRSRESGEREVGSSGARELRSREIQNWCFEKLRAREIGSSRSWKLGSQKTKKSEIKS